MREIPRRKAYAEVTVRIGENGNNRPLISKGISRHSGKPSFNKAGWFSHFSIRAISAKSFSLPSFFFIWISPSTHTTGTPLTISTVPSSQFSKISISSEYMIFLVPSSQRETMYPCCSNLSARSVLHPKSISRVCGRNPCKTIAPPATTQYSFSGKGSSLRR